VVQWRRLEDTRGDWPTYAELAAALHGATRDANAGHG
jgi:hypothetical protein